MTKRIKAAMLTLKNRLKLALEELVGPGAHIDASERLRGGNRESKP